MTLDEIEANLRALCAAGQRSKNAVIFDEGRLCLVRAKDTRRGMLVSTSIVNGRRWYLHSTSSADEKRLGLDQLRFMHQVELAERLADEFIPRPALQPA